MSFKFEKLENEIYMKISENSVDGNYKVFHFKICFSKKIKYDIKI